MPPAETFRTAMMLTSFPRISACAYTSMRELLRFDPGGSAISRPLYARDERPRRLETHPQVCGVGVAPPHDRLGRIHGHQAPEESVRHLVDGGANDLERQRTGARPVPGGDLGGH